VPDYVGTFAVTPAALGALASAVSRAGDQLASTPDLALSCVDSLGSTVVASALSHFVSGWHDGRAQICSEVAALASALGEASVTYSATDGDLAAAIPGTS
jgi:hypothetical protein